MPQQEDTQKSDGGLTAPAKKRKPRTPKYIKYAQRHGIRLFNHLGKASILIKPNTPANAVKKLRELMREKT